MKTLTRDTCPSCGLQIVIDADGNLTTHTIRVRDNSGRTRYTTCPADRGEKR